MIMIMLIFIYEKDALQIFAKNRQQSLNLRIPVYEFYLNAFVDTLQIR